MTHRRRLVIGLGTLTASVLALAVVASDERARRGRGDARLAVETEADARVSPTCPRTSYDWPFAVGPFYGDLPARRDGRALPVLRTIVGEFDLTTSALGIPEALTTKNELARLGRQYFDGGFRSGRRAPLTGGPRNMAAPKRGAEQRRHRAA